MAVPVATALVEGVKIKVYDASDLPVTVSLTGSGTESPTAYEWSILRDRKVNPGGVPQASGVVSGTHGNFTDGLSSTQNPSITLDVTGAYKFSLRAQNGEGWSDPSYVEGDGEGAECIVIIKTEYGNKLPAPNHYRYEYILEELLRTLEQNSAGASSAIYIPSLWVKPETPHAEDDEFESETLNGWTESFTASSSAIDPYAKFASGDPRRVVHTEPYRSWYLIQPPADSAFYALHKPITVPTNAFFWFRARSFDRHAGLGTNNDSTLVFGIYATSGGEPDPDNLIQIFANECDGTDFRLQFLIRNSGVNGTDISGPDRHQKGQTFEYFGIAKIGTTFYGYAYTESGQTYFIGKGTYSGAGTLDRVGCRFVNVNTNDPGNTIIGVDFFRMVESATYFPGYGKLDIPGANYSKPENIPTLSYSSTSVVNVQSAPGASSTLRANLNDGVRRTATSPLTVDLTVSGRGGLDTGSEASDAWYYIYLIPNAIGTGLSTIASETDPDSGGPTGYPIWRYIGAIRNLSGDIRKFKQVGSNFFYTVGYNVYSNTTVAPFTLASLDISAGVPGTCNRLLGQCKVDTTSSGQGFQYWVTGDSANKSYQHVQAYAASGGAITEMVSIDVPILTSQTVWHELDLIAGSGSAAYVELRILGWTDGYLSSSEAQLQAVYTPDTKTPQGTWATAGAEVDFDARPSQPSTSLHTFQDGLQRSMTTGTWAIANGVAMWGYDEAGSQGNDKWLYFYLVPITDSTMGVIASDNPPSTGPAGYSNYRLCWEAYITSGALVKTYQYDNRFEYANDPVPSAESGWGTTLQDPKVEIAINDVVPITAVVAAWWSTFTVNNPSSTNLEQLVYIEGETTHKQSISINTTQETARMTGCLPLPGTASKKIGYMSRDLGTSGTILVQNLYISGWVSGYIDA